MSEMQSDLQVLEVGETRTVAAETTALVDGQPFTFTSRVRLVRDHANLRSAQEPLVKVEALFSMNAAEGVFMRGPDIVPFPGSATIQARFLPGDDNEEEHAGAASQLSNAAASHEREVFAATHAARQMNEEIRRRAEAKKAAADSSVNN